MDKQQLDLQIEKAHQEIKNLNNINLNNYESDDDSDYNPEVR